MVFEGFTLGHLLSSFLGLRCSVQLLGQIPALLLCNLSHGGCSHGVTPIGMVMTRARILARRQLPSLA